MLPHFLVLDMEMGEHSFYLVNWNFMLNPKSCVVVG